MEISIKYQLLTTFLSVILGLFFGVIYDWFKIIRKFLIGSISKKLISIINRIKFPLITVNFKKNFKDKNDDARQLS